ncbi:hypothetical protein JQ557_23380 [Bradyrhizobium sp. U87765 SZCCT0131]|uniref:hypothetical protein n=1 Tax=unclassified Bradyrhizobium TaxID=2631580 RepID=UPI001BAD0F16|nr:MULTISPECIES: hypothetical protein [unclassified Bradyrhizobium]MBR1220959.1 hypothetical protein [Bradyrhizobium sp. U87765 SZCCT0131]MBR1260221.1 hypothetical protein [Bradyrhizobium sp. U87765 SZCCT0134]MBR1307530.1 hypothetical protein [Bradyrhizobium sp. U87765 SZCCT0110]MBR1321484.1 hypothetical protein [Bradyrhizobium sp. U87765 SZCCT0109]MBR1349797.1 hypothetical protein [Bradyrhizobium sp. U87765 SZCCT0048]
MTQVSDFSLDRLDTLLHSHHVKLGERQRGRLHWLATRLGAPVIWEGPESHIAGSGLVVVLEPPTGPRAELFFRTLDDRSVVVIPFGENPAFDFLKSKLIDFGTIGAAGSEGPHELWWGGMNWGAIAHHDVRAPLPRVESCYARALGADHITHLARSLTALELDFDITPRDDAPAGPLHGRDKADFILQMWETHDQPILWVDADAMLLEPPHLPAAIDGDFAVHKWNRWEMSTRVLYFGRSAAAEALLRTWRDFSHAYPGVWDGHALDQAWSVVSSQRALDTVWLPRSYHTMQGDQGTRPVILHKRETTTASLGPDGGYPKALRTARRACRTGPPESLIVITAPEATIQPVTVILRDTQSAGARTVAASVEAVADAFAGDPAGFSHLELSLCPWQDDVKTATAVATSARHRILELAPTDPIDGDLFRTLAATSGSSLRQNIVPLRRPRSPA